MKHVLFVLGLTAVSIPVIAQQHDHSSYQKSVFTGYEQSGMINTEFHTQTRAEAKKNFPTWAVDIDKRTGNFADIYGDALVVNGQTPVEKAQYIMEHKLSKLSIIKNEWKVTRDASAPRAHYVGFEQYIDGHKVMFSNLSFRFTKDGRLVRVSNMSFGKMQKSSAPQLVAADIKTSSEIREGISGVSISSVAVSDEWVWFPIPTASGYALQPAWEFTAIGMEGERMPVELNGFIDAVTGELLYRSNEVKEILDVQAKASVYKQNYASAATLEPMGNIEVILGSTTANADDTGYISHTATSLNVTFKLKGLWSTVFPQGTSGTPAYSQIVTGIGNIFTFPSTGMESRAVNAYYHTNRAHENMKSLLPSFTGMDISLPTNIELSSGTCNAFYNGGSINFYAPGGGCPSFAEIGDIVYHEYGHGINRTFYSSQGVNTMRNGALNEGYADVWAMTITQDSILGREAKGPSSFIRRYDTDYKVYPQNIVGEVHADGEIIAGAWWDVARNIGSYETMAQIFADAFYDVADGPNGMEGPVFHKVLIAAILSDDNDATLSNGTPHFQEIVSAFAKHGIYMYADAKLTHQELAHQPQNTPITVNASLTLTNSDFFQGLKLFYRNRAVGTWDSLWMTDNGGFNFTGQIPPQTQGSLVDYHFYIYDYLAIPTVSFPFGFNRDPSMSTQSTIPYQFAVGVSPRVQVTFEEETLDGWELGLSNDNATAGKWILAKPVGTFYTPNGGAFGSFITQIDKDHTSGAGKCLVTGNGTSNYTGADVDNGRTTILTPVLDLTSYVNPIIEYYRWYSNDRTGGSSESKRRNDLWKAEVGLSSTASWKIVENTYQSDYNWRRRVFAVDQYLPGHRTIQMKFTASDNVLNGQTASGQSVVEAAIDDFFIYDGVPTSINDVMPVKARIYPNPADQNVIITLPGAVKGIITLYNLMGQEISRWQMDGILSKYIIDTRHLANGQYMLVIQGENKTIQSNKLIVTHK